MRVRELIERLESLVEALGDPVVLIPGYADCELEDFILCPIGGGSGTAIDIRASTVWCRRLGNFTCRETGNGDRSEAMIPAGH